MSARVREKIKTISTASLSAGRKSAEFIQPAESEGVIFMNRFAGTFVKGVATGIAVGTAVGTVVNRVGHPISNRSRNQMKRNAAKALHAVGDVIQNVQYMMK